MNIKDTIRQTLLEDLSHETSFKTNLFKLLGLPLPQTIVVGMEKTHYANAASMDLQFNQKERWIIVDVDETNDGKKGLYYFDGVQLLNFNKLISL